MVRIKSMEVGHDIEVRGRTVGTDREDSWFPLQRNSRESLAEHVVWWKGSANGDIMDPPLPGSDSQAFQDFTCLYQSGHCWVLLALSMAKGEKWNPRRILVPTSETFHRLDFDWTFLWKADMQFEQSAKSAERGSEAFPWQNKTLIKTQSTVCTKLRPLSQPLSDSYQQWAGTVSKSIALAGKTVLIQAFAVSSELNSIHSFIVPREKFSVEPSTIKQQRL